MDYLMDTNSVSAMLKQNDKIWVKVALVEFAGEKIFFNTISYFESKRGLLASQATRKMPDFDEMRQDYDMRGRC